MNNNQVYTVQITEFQRKMLMMLAMVAQLHNYSKLFQTKGNQFATMYDEIKQFRRMLHKLEVDNHTAMEAQTV